jgi:hypothetical protein
MKKKPMLTGIILIILMQPAHLYAQKTTFALSGGYCTAFYFTKSDGSAESDFNNGLFTGANLRLAMGKHWHFEPGLFFAQKGGVEKVDASVYGSYKSIVKLNYLEVPVNFVYSKRDYFFFGFGPSVGFALSGKQKLKYDSGKETYKIDFGSSTDDDLKGVDAGLTLLIGWHWNGLFSLININTSFNNISNDRSQYFSNNYMCLGFGYRFSGKK